MPTNDTVAFATLRAVIGGDANPVELCRGTETWIDVFGWPPVLFEERAQSGDGRFESRPTPYRESVAMEPLTPIGM